MGKADKKGIAIQEAGDNKWKLRPADITIVERPKEGEKDKIFYNARGVPSLQDDGMVELRTSIQVDGLKVDPWVWAVTDKHKTTTQVLLIAGECRLRNILYIIDNDLPCFDPKAPKLSDYKDGSWVVHKGQLAEVTKHDGDKLVLAYQDGTTGEAAAKDCKPTRPGSKVYEWIECLIHWDITEEEALRLSCIENKQRRNLTIREEIELVERLERQGFKQEEIKFLTGQKNITWISQTANFRKDLPPEAFDKLINDLMTRNVAVTIMSYDEEHRQAIFEAADDHAADEHRQEMLDLRLEQEQHEDEEDQAKSEAAKALAEGDLEAAAKAEKRAKAAANKAKKTGSKRAKTAKQAGHVSQGHVSTAAKALGIKPRKAKMLSKPDVEESWIDKPKQWEKDGEIDPVCEKRYPTDLLRLTASIAQAICDGSHNPGKVIRDFLIEKGKWEVVNAEAEVDEPTAVPDDDLDNDPDIEEPAAEVADDDDDIGTVEAVPGNGRRKKKAEPEPVAVGDDD